MYELINTIFADGQTFGFVMSFAGALFFTAVAYREIRDGFMHGVLYYFVAAFLLVAHFAIIVIARTSFGNTMFQPPTELFDWINVAVGPSLVVLFIAVGAFRVAISQVRLGAIRLFFGVTLICYLYLLGATWPLDVKAFITMAYIITWFEVETVAG